VIFATGFDTFDFCSSIDVKGVSGRTLAAAWGGEPRAYYGMMVPDFPNVRVTGMSLLLHWFSLMTGVHGCSCFSRMGPTLTSATIPSCNPSLPLVHELWMAPAIMTGCGCCAPGL
jgi:hypothetical protein